MRPVYRGGTEGGLDGLHGPPVEPLDWRSGRSARVLSAAGAQQRVAQALARHAKIETTMAAYTDLTCLDLRGAIEKTVSNRAAREANVAGA